MPTQEEAKVSYKLDDWIGTFQGDSRRNYTLEFLQAEGLDKNHQLLGTNKEELAVVTLTCTENANLFIAISGHKKEFDLLNLSSVVKELHDKEEQFQSINISLGAMTPQQSVAKRKEKLDSTRPVISFITQSFSTDNEDSSDVESLLKDRSKKHDDTDKAVQFADLETNAFLNKSKNKTKNADQSGSNNNNNNNNNNNTNDKKDSKVNKSGGGNDIESLIAAAVAKADEIDTNDTVSDEFKSLELSTDFPDVDQDIFGDNDNIHATFAELVECIGDCDVDVTVSESRLRDDKILINFKLEEMSEQIVKAKTIFVDSVYDKWGGFTSDFGLVNRKSKLVIDEAEDYDGGFLVDGTMATVAFNFDQFPNFHEKWNEIVKKIEANPVIEDIINLLTKDEEATVHVIDKLDTDCVVSLEFTPKE